MCAYSGVAARWVYLRVQANDAINGREAIGKIRGWSSGGGSLRTNWRITTARRQRDSGRQQSWIRDTHQTDAQPRCRCQHLFLYFQEILETPGLNQSQDQHHMCVPKHYEKNIKMHLFCFACSFRWKPSEEREGESINWNRRSRKHFGSIEGKIQYLVLKSI